MFDETPQAAWNARLGTDPPPDLPDLGKFLNHRSVRKYKPDPVPEATVQGLIAAAQSAATSSNLQLWSVVSVQEPERREAIAKLCADQSQVREAAWFFAFLADHHRLIEAAKQVGEDPAGLDYEEFFIMALVDVALAAERMVCAAESLGLGICYIGAMRNDPPGVQQLLNLPEHVFSPFGLCVGWPEEPLTAEIKPKLSPDAVWFREAYQSDVDVSEYDARMQAFYESQGMKGEVTWSMRSGKRVNGSERSMSGRMVLKEFIQKQGFAKR
ncbi:MAG: nitroreductase family protein [Fimbriimonadaceae bacterium]|nr:nitroreductase family protein [Fimbriimonadaceae bacterium]